MESVRLIMVCNMHTCVHCTNGYLSTTSSTEASRITIIIMFLTASDGDGINCHIVEEIGRSIKEFENVNILESSLQSSSQVRTLVGLKECLKIGYQNDTFDPNVLSSRPVVLLERWEDVTPFLKFELCSTSILKYSQMSKTNNAVPKQI